MQDLNYYINVELPIIIKNEINVFLAKLNQFWFVYLFLAFILFFYVLYFFKKYVIQKKEFINMDELLKKLASTNEIDKEEKLILNELNFSDDIGFYQLRGNVYILLDSKTKNVQMPFRIRLDELDDIKKIGKYYISYIKNSDNKYMLLFANKKTMSLENYEGHLIFILNYYEKMFEGYFKDGIKEFSRKSANSFMKINFNQDSFFKFIVHLIDKVVKNSNIVLLKHDKIEYCIKELDEKHSYKKIFYIRNTPYKLVIYSSYALTNEEVRKIGTFIDFASHYLVNFSQNKLIVENYINLLKIANQAFEMSNIYYKHHSKIVEIVSVEVAKALYLPQNDIDNISLAAQLHDIGMLGDILNIIDKEELNKEEINLIKQHPIIGAEIVEPINHINNIADIIKYHHERYDGKGYPFGLKGINIPVNSNILALGEYYAGITSDRKYRKGKSHNQAIEDIKNLSDKYFEKSIVEAFLSVEKRINTKIMKVKNE